MSMSNTFVYDGSGSYIDFNSIFSGNFVTWYFEVSVYYGNLIETLGVPTAIAPTATLPALPGNAPVTVTIYRGTSYSKCVYLGHYPIYNTNHVYLGEKYVFSEQNNRTNDPTQYTANWSFGGVTVPYGADEVVINPVSGVSNTFINED